MAAREDDETTEPFLNRGDREKIQVKKLVISQQALQWLESYNTMVWPVIGSKIHTPFLFGKAPQPRIWNQA